MMEKLLEHNGEKVRQVDAVSMTSSFVVQASNKRSKSEQKDAT